MKGFGILSNKTVTYPLRMEELKVITQVMKWLIKGVVVNRIGV